MTIEVLEESGLILDWELHKVDEEKVRSIMNEFGLSQLVARLLCIRGLGIDEVDHFLNPRIKNHLVDPFQLLDMDKAVEKLKKSIGSNQKILIYGDYDVDGACSSSLLKLYLRKLGVESEIYIPDRVKDGYGPNKAVLTRMRRDRDFELCITVDCGTVANSVLNYVSGIGLDVIVIDHHISTDVLPQVVSVINPNRFDQRDCNCSDLAAVGVVFLFLIALNKSLREEGFFEKLQLGEPNLFEYLDLVALGTVCDVMKIRGLNRAIVYQGLKIISRRSNLGLSVLMDMLNVAGSVEVYHLGYLIGPTINAGGRIGKSHLGSCLLSSDCKTTATEITSELYWYNQKRKAIEADIIEDSINQVSGKEDFVMVVGEGWHQGVIGIVASRVKERFNVPVAVISIDEDLGKGSARSVPGVDFGAMVLDAKSEGIIEEGGGHSMAAGFTVRRENIDKLREFFELKVKNLAIKTEKNKADAMVSIDALNMDLVNQVRLLAPFGPGNPEPIFMINDAVIVYSKIVSEVHISCTMRGRFSSSSVRAIAFRGLEKKFAAKLLNKEPFMFVMGKVKLDNWKGVDTLSFVIEDIV